MTVYGCQGSTTLLGPGVGPLLGETPPPPTEAAPFVFFGDECIIRLVSWGGDVTNVKPFVHVGVDVEP